MKHSRKFPKIACCNFLPDRQAVKEFAFDNGFDGVDWTFTREDALERHFEKRQAHLIRDLSPLEVRFHLYFRGMELGHEDPVQRNSALFIYFKVLRFIASMGGRFTTIHVGLQDTLHSDLSWDATVRGLSLLSAFARTSRLILSVENLATGWTASPALYLRLLHAAGLWSTIDIGHTSGYAHDPAQACDLAGFLDRVRRRVVHAHIYHQEIGGVGHIPPESPWDCASRLDNLLGRTHCNWWTLELREETVALQTLKHVRAFLRFTAGEKNIGQDLLERRLLPTSLTKKLKMRAD